MDKSFDNWLKNFCVNMPCQIVTKGDKTDIERLLKIRLGGGGRFGDPCARLTSELFRLKCFPNEIEGSPVKKENTKVYSVLGAGSYGTVLGICNGVRLFALKIMQNKYGGAWHNSEIKMQNAFHNLGLAPKIYHTAETKELVFILMEQIDRTLHQYLIDEQRNLDTAQLQRICDDIEQSVRLQSVRRIYHGDMHLHNISVKEKDGEYMGIGLIDFGFSGIRDEEDDEILNVNLQLLKEYISMLRSIDDELGVVESKLRAIIMAKIRAPEMSQMANIFIVDEDVEFSLQTQDDCILLIHEFWSKKGEL